MKLTTGERIANAACEWLGTPYQNNAMVKGKGRLLIFIGGCSG